MGEIWAGTNKIKSVYVGTNKIKKIYAGSTLVWSGEPSYYGFTTNLSQARYGVSGISIGNYALMGGGSLPGSGSSGYSNIVDTYTSSLTKNTATTLRGRRRYIATTNISSDYALFAGGDGSTNELGLYVDAYNYSLVRSTLTDLFGNGDSTPASASVGNYAIFTNLGHFRKEVDTYNNSLVKGTSLSLSYGRKGLGGTSNGSYAIFGGGIELNKGESIAVDTVEAFNSSLVKSTPIALSIARGDPSGVRVGNYGLLISGYDYGIKSVIDAYSTSLSRSTPSPLNPIRYNTYNVTTKDFALVYGGYDRYLFRNEIDTYSNDLVKAQLPGINAIRYSLAIASIGDYVLFGGGRNDTTTYLDTVEVYEV